MSCVGFSGAHKGQLASEWIYEDIIFPKYQLKGFIASLGLPGIFY